VRTTGQNVVQPLQCYLRAVELEMRAAEEPLRGNLDVKGLRAQVLARIETLEKQEREKEELLQGVTAMAEEHGLDAGALKAVIGGLGLGSVRRTYELQKNWWRARDADSQGGKSRHSMRWMTPACAPRTVPLPYGGPEPPRAANVARATTEAEALEGGVHELVESKEGAQRVRHH
jgi:hypothetical protein